MNKRLRKSRYDKKIAGVCGGLAEYFEIDPTLVRILFFAGFIFGLGSPGLIYIILWAVLPEDF